VQYLGDVTIFLPAQLQKHRLELLRSVLPLTRNKSCCLSACSQCMKQIICLCSNVLKTLHGLGV